MYKQLMWIFVITFLFSQSCMANEEQDAISACKNAANLLAQKPGKSYQDEAAFERGLCNSTEHSALQWNCVAKSIANNNSLNFSTSQCFQKNKKNILIGVNEEEKAKIVCFRTLAIAKQNGAQNAFKFICTANTKNSATWLCVKKLVEKHNSLNFSMSQCF